MDETTCGWDPGWGSHRADGAEGADGAKVSDGWGSRCTRRVRGRLTGSLPHSGKRSTMVSSVGGNVWDGKWCDDNGISNAMEAGSVDTR